MSTMSNTPYEDRSAADAIRAKAVLDALLGRGSGDPAQEATLDALLGRSPGDPAQEAMSADHRKARLDEIKANVLEATELVGTARKGLESQGVEGEALGAMTQVFWHTLTHKLFS